MPELKSLGRQIAQPSAPDISGAAQAYTSLGTLVTQAAQTVGEYVQANNTLIEKSLIAKATDEFETSYIHFKNDPNITMESLDLFTKDLQTKTEGIIQAAPPGREKSTSASLSDLIGQYSNKALNDTLQQGQKNEIRDISLGIYEYQNALSRQISEGDYGSALETKTHLSEYVRALAQKGVSAEKIISISEDTDILAISAEGSSRLKSAQSLDERTAIVQQYANLPETPVNTKAFNAIYKEYGRLNKLYKEGIDLSDPYRNIIDGSNWKNRDLKQADADQLVDIVSKNVNAHTREPAGSPIDTPVYQSLPSYPGQPKTYDFDEEIAAAREGRPERNYLVESVVQTKEGQPQREPNIFELANAHAQVGSKNASKFPSLVTNILYGANGDQVNNAVSAIGFVNETNPTSLELDDTTEMLYTLFNTAKNTGRIDYDEMIKEARDVVLNKAKGSIEINTALYNAKFSTSGKGLSNLNKAFKSATGVDAIDTGSIQSLTDFNNILKSRTILSDGNNDAALESAKRQMARTHGVDNYTGGKYVPFPPSLMLQGQSEVQIGNQFILQLVGFSEKNPDLKLSDRYKRIKEANDYDRANVDYRSLAKAQTGGTNKHIPLLTGHSNGIEITQNIEGEGHITGEFFVRPNELTEQNNSGMPVWEAWMRDGQGREFPIIDNNSPEKNILLVFGRPLDKFAPEYAKDLSDDQVKKTAQEVLEAEGRQLYGFSSYIPFTTARKSKKSYVENLENVERVSGKVKKILGKEEPK